MQLLMWTLLVFHSPSNAQVNITDVSGVGAVTNANNTALWFGTNSIERMRIDNAGNVGIGTTTPTVKLDVFGVINSATGGIRFPDNSTMTTAGAASTGANNNTDITISADTDANGSGAVVLSTRMSERFRLTNAGLVGIGTEFPVSLVDLSDANGGILTLSRNDTSATAADTIGKIQFWNNDTQLTTQNIYAEIEGQADATVASNAATGNLIFRTTSTTVAGAPVERMRIDSSGNVAIGTTTPTSKFMIAPPATQTIAAGDTVAADACGTLKKISSAGNVTTNTTNTFTAPATGNAGCCMDVVNVGANTITLDDNALSTLDGGDAVLGPRDAARVCSQGSNWVQMATTSDN